MDPSPPDNVIVNNGRKAPAASNTQIITVMDIQRVFVFNSSFVTRNTAMTTERLAKNPILRSRRTVHPPISVVVVVTSHPIDGHDKETTTTEPNPNETERKTTEKRKVQKNTRRIQANPKSDRGVQCGVVKRSAEK